MKLLFMLTLVSIVSCSTSEYYKIPITVNSQQFRSLIEGFATAYEEIEVSPGPFNEDSQAVMHEVLYDIEDLIRQFRHDFEDSSLYFQTLYLDKYHDVFIPINHDYDKAVRLIAVNWLDLDEETRIQFLTEHNKTLQYVEVYRKMLWSKEFLQYMDRLLSIVISIATVAKQVTG